MAQEGQSAPPGPPIERDTGILEARLGRRRFLQVSGSSVLGLLGAGPVLAATRGTDGGVAAPPTIDAADPIGELAALLDYDVERIFRFVADEVRYEPYPGVLRGALGTLQGRSGNSTDQALLLAALLDAALVTPRFVSGSIDDEQAESILATATTDLAEVRDEASSILAGSMRPVTEIPELEPEIQATVDRLPEIASSARAVAEEQLDRSVRTIVGALADAGIEVPMSTSSMPVLEREQHVWVQVPSGSTWLDLDPTPPEAQAGVALTVAVGEPMSALPDELRHRIELEVVGERVSRGVLTTESLVGHAAYADELAGVPILLLHERPGALEGLGIGIAGVLTGSSAYQPILQVGDLALIGVSGLTFGGEGGVLGPLFDLEEFGDGASGGPEATAEWLDVHITPPMGERTSVRRALFDRIGDSVRASGRVDGTDIEPAEMVALDEDHPAEYLPLRSVHVLAVAGGPTPLDVVVDAATDETGDAALEQSGQLFHLGRDILAADLALERGVRTFLDGPNVTAYTIGVTSTDAATPVESYGLDIMARSFGHLATADATAEQPPGVLSGVLAQVVERIMIGDALPADMAPDVPAVSVGAILDVAAVQGIGVRAVQGQLPESVVLPAPARERLERALADGWVAILPERPVTIGGADRAGWWLVDPVSGRTVDMLDDGRGGAIVEYVGTKAAIVWRAIRPVVKFAACLRLILAFISFIVTTALADGSGQVIALASLLTGAKPGRWGCTC